MASAVQYIEILHYNPFVLGPLFPLFYEKLGRRPNSIVLSFLILPLTLHREAQRFLKNANARSSLRTFVAERERLFGLPQRIAAHREITFTALQYCIDCGAVELVEDLAVIAASTKLPTNACPADSARAASRLGMLFAPLDTPAIYRALGVKRV